MTSDHLAFQTDPESNPRHAVACQGEGDLASCTGVVLIDVGRSHFLPPVGDVDAVSPRESVGEGFFAEIDGAVGLGRGGIGLAFDGGWLYEEEEEEGRREEESSMVDDEGST